MINSKYLVIDNINYVLITKGLSMYSILIFKNLKSKYCKKNKI